MHALIATADPALADDLARLAAAADVPAETVDDLDGVRLRWRDAPLVLVGADLAARLTGVAPRAGVVLISRSPARDDFREAFQIGAREIATVPGDENWLVEILAAAALPDGPRGRVVCVTAARGGAGGSVLAAALALRAARDGLRTLLVDGDPDGGGLDVLVGADGQDGVRWHELAARRGRLGAGTLRESVHRVGDLSVLTSRGGLAVPAESAAAVLGAARLGFDLTIVDLPRRLDDLATVALRAAETTYLLVPAEVRPALAAARQVERLTALAGDVRLIVGQPSPGALDAATINTAVPLPLAGVLERDSRLASRIEHHNLTAACDRGPLADLCTSLLRDLRPGRPATEHRAAA